MNGTEAVHYNRNRLCPVPFRIVTEDDPYKKIVNPRNDTEVIPYIALPSPVGIGFHPEPVFS